MLSHAASSAGHPLTVCWIWHSSCSKREIQLLHSAYSIYNVIKQSTHGTTVTFSYFVSLTMMETLCTNVTADWWPGGGSKVHESSHYTLHSYSLLHRSYRKVVGWMVGLKSAGLWHQSLHPESHVGLGLADKTATRLVKGYGLGLSVSLAFSVFFCIKPRPWSFPNPNQVPWGA